ncbi:MAG: sugar ABC transporter substrate-binding protein [Candidatus Omnitrophica bacterium]|nr:sugar ABC transporter substrate-binding protein [Candidatus Omnitrophota bacterium]MCM8798216.1 sugar ABC transporter substrate-binding protein [Candidatus Omnitrophota bacterium]
MGKKFLFFLIFFGFFLSGCGKKLSKDNLPVIKVAFWGTPEEVEIIQSIIEPWQKEHPEIKVELEHTPFAGYVNKILTRVAGGAPPDVICVEANLFVSLWSKGIFLNLNPFLEKEEDFSVTDFFPEVVGRFTVEGKIYGIPRDTAPFACIYYNKKLFDAKGVSYPTDEWTWQDLLEKAKALTEYDKEGRPICYGFYGWAWQNFVYSNGGALVDNVEKPRRCLLDTPESIEGLEFYVDLIHKYRVSPTPNALINLGMGVQMMFMTGRLAMFSSGIWETPILRKAKDFDWDVVMFPKGPKGIRAFGTGGSAYGILKTTKYPEEAWKVVKALTDERAQTILADSGLAQPANRKIAVGEHFADDNRLPLNKKMLNEAVKYIIYEPFHENWREINELYIVPELDMVFNGQKTVKEAMAKIVPEINRLLEERR